MTERVPPKLSPLEALKRLRAGPDPFMEDGFKFYLDGPMMCPVEYMYPCAEPLVEPDDGCWYPTGGAETDITEATTWVYL